MDGGRQLTGSSQQRCDIGLRAAVRVRVTQQRDQRGPFVQEQAHISSSLGEL